MRPKPTLPARRGLRRPRRGKERSVTVVGFHASHEQAHPGELLAAVQRAEEVGLRRRHVLGPLRAVERATGSQRVRVVVARRRAGDARHSRSASSPPPASGTTRRSSPRPPPPWRRCSPVGSGWPSGPARPSTSTSPVTAGHPSRSGRRACSSASRSSGPSTPGRRSPTEGSCTSTEPASGRSQIRPPPLVGAAVSEETAAWCASWADGLITVNQPIDVLRRVLDAYRERRRPGSRPSSRSHVSYAVDAAHRARGRPRPVAQRRDRAARRAGTPTRSRPSTP